jgi:hypothetical protein
MRDVKDLLEPLSRREMPDRWEAIQRRHVDPLPDPRRSRVGAYVMAAVVSLLAVAVIAWLAPLGTDDPLPRSWGESQPPWWLVQKAYELAYENGDLTPESADWILADEETIASATGQQGDGSNEPLYVVVLHGDFTAYGAKGVTGEDPSTGTVLFARIEPDPDGVMAWGVRSNEVDVAGLQSFTLPDLSQMFLTADGWRIALPPSWHAQGSSIQWEGEPVEQVVIANTSLTALTFAYEPMPVVADTGFLPDGVALVATTVPPGFPDLPSYAPPLSLSDFERSTGADGSTIGMALMQGPEHRYAVTVRIGPEASPVDRAAIEAALGSIAFA